MFLSCFDKQVSNPFFFLFYSQQKTSYNSPWNWTTVTASGEWHNLGTRKESNNTSANMHHSSAAAAAAALQNSVMHHNASGNSGNNSSSGNTSNAGMNQQSNRALPQFGFDFSNFHNTY